MIPRFSENYRPLYFLAALGMGGLSISFFMYLMFLVPHPDTPIPTFDALATQFAKGTMLSNTLMVVALLAIAYFAVRHVQLLIANIGAHRRFSRTPEYTALISSNGEVQLMAIPLTLSMTVSVLFVLGALAIPGLWDIKEWLFPFALAANIAIGAYALRLFGRYITRILSDGSFNVDDTNHFSQVLPSFAFAMIGVGFSSSAAMSNTLVTSLIGAAGTALFLAAAALWGFVKMPVSFGAMLRHGMAREAGPTLWLAIPILTLFGIAGIRVSSGIAHNILHANIPNIVWLVVFGALIALQLIVGLFGWAVMRRQDYFSHFVSGPGRSIPAYGLICPGVALAVLSQFFIGRGLVATGVLEKFSIPHLALLTLIFALQLLTIRTVARLNAKLLGAPKASEEDKAEAQAA